MRTRADGRLGALLAASVLLALYVALALFGSGTTERNRRRTMLSRPAYLAQTVSGGFARHDTSLVLAQSPSGAPSTASWDLSTYEIDHVLGAAQRCRASVFLLPTTLTGTSSRAAIDVLLGGAVVGHIRFSRRRAGFYAASPDALVPDSTPQLVELVPLDRRFGFVFALAPRFCAARDWTLAVRARDVTGTFSHVGAILEYAPAAAATFPARAPRIVAGLCVAALLSALLIATLLRLATLGGAVLAAATLVLAVAPLGYDQWDFPIWMRFAEAAAFGGADPARLWSASPLWAYVPPLLSTVTVASYLLTGDGSRTITELLLKIALGIAYCYNAYALALRAPLARRRLVVMAAIFAPGALYVLAAGYREPFAAAFMLIALALAERKHLAFATFAMWIAVSISETLLPMLLFPAALRLTYDDPRAPRVRAAVALAALGVGLFATEWLALVPRDLAARALAYRFGTAQLGGASWQGALAGLGLLPRWLPVGSPALGAGIFTLGALVALRRLGADASLRARTPRIRFARVFGTFVALVAAFFLAFRGVDPNTWYTLLVAAAAYFAMVDAMNPFPLLLGGVLGLAFYGVVGLGEFVNHALFWPFDRGLLGILGISRYIFDLMLAALAACFFFAAAFDRADGLTSSQTPWFVALFFAAVATSAIEWNPTDVVAYASVSVLVVLAVMRGIAAQRRSSGSPAPARRALGVVAIGGTAAVLGTRSFPGAAASLAALALSSTAAIGSCDVVLAAGAAGVLAVQRGFGWTSIAGWIALASLALVACVRVALRKSHAILRNRFLRADTSGSEPRERS